MKQDLLQESIEFFEKISLDIIDITTDKERGNKNKVVEVVYRYNGSEFKTKPLYYREITDLDNVKDIDRLYNFFEGDIYWLDIEKHKWPRSSGESNLDNLVINDMIDRYDLLYL